METVTQPDELLPCPFCGYTTKRRNVEFQRGTEDREGTPIAVFCPDCAATVPFEYCPAENSDMAVTAWNTRAAPRIDDQVDVEGLKRGLFDAIAENYGDDPTHVCIIADVIDYLTAHYEIRNLTRKD